MIPPVVDHVVRSIVEHPDQIRIETREGSVEGRSAITIFVASNDVGRLVGSGGAVIRALRLLLSLVDRSTAWEIVVDRIDRNPIS